MDKGSSQRCAGRAKDENPQGVLDEEKMKIRGGAKSVFIDKSKNTKSNEKIFQLFLTWFVGVSMESVRGDAGGASLDQAAKGFADSLCHQQQNRPNVTDYTSPSTALLGKVLWDTVTYSHLAICSFLSPLIVLLGSTIKVHLVLVNPYRS